MKTNHQRAFKATAHRDQSMWGRSKKLQTRVIVASIGNDFTNGHRGMAKAKRGAKKFLRSRERLEGKELVRQDVSEASA